MQTGLPTPRPIDTDVLVYPKEKLWFMIAVLISVSVYIALVATILESSEFAGPIIFYILLFALVYLIANGLHLGHIRGNGIRVSAKQFPELMAMADSHARRLGMEETPAIFVLQSGGVLNAFATRFLGRNFVVLYSDMLALATQKGEKAVSFVLGHELGHIQRKHITRRALLYPAMAVPFLGSAYSRACEFTCDRYGNALEPEAGVDGLLVLAAGRDLYSQVDSAEFSMQADAETGFFVHFAEVLATHPHLTKRVAALSAVRKHQRVTSHPPILRPVNPGSF
jgi:Zn-dependent protease with chaperone function